MSLQCPWPSSPTHHLVVTQLSVREEGTRGHGSVMVMSEEGWGNGNSVWGIAESGDLVM